MDSFYKATRHALQDVGNVHVGYYNDRWHPAWVRLRDETPGYDVVKSLYGVIGSCQQQTRGFVDADGVQVGACLRSLS